MLLILAGITINLTIGEDGILKKVEEAGKNYTEAAEKEKTELAQFSNLTDKIIDNVTKNHYTIIEGVPVPKGFSHKEGTKDTGFVIKNDTDGNEFVWVPCTIDGANGSIQYARYSFGSFANSSYSETMPSDEQTSVNTYGGYYIGRYESGVSGYDAEVSKNNSSSSEEWTGYSNGKLVIKQNQQVWNYITRDMAKNVSEALYKKSNGDSVNSRLCSSYAWDTALKFIDTTMMGYSTSGMGGNYKDKTFDYTDLEGITQNKAENTSILIPTGQTQTINNIYDIGGNAYELTTEYCDRNGMALCVSRGGSHMYNSSTVPAARRHYCLKVDAWGDVSFRTTLYL